jgi:hypothetical protein
MVATVLHRYTIKQDPDWPEMIWKVVMVEKVSSFSPVGVPRTTYCAPRNTRRATRTR